MTRVPTPREASIFDVPSVNDIPRLDTGDILEMFDARIDANVAAAHTFPPEPTAYAATPIAFDAVDRAILEVHERAMRPPTPLPRARVPRASEQPLRRFACDDEAIEIDTESFDDFYTGVTLVQDRDDTLS